MRVLPLVLTLLGLAVLAGCERSSPPSVSSHEIIWVDRDTPRSIDLAGTVHGRSIEIAGNGDIAASAEGLTVTLNPRAGFTGRAELPFTVSRSGQSASGVLAVRVKDGARSCSTRFQYEGTGSAVFLAGTFNGFSATAEPMSETGPARFETVVPLAAGSWAYKFVVDGAYVLDPANPLTMFEGGIENSRARAEDCAMPRLDAFHSAATADGTFAVDVAFVSASDLAPVVAPPQATLDGAAWTGTWNEDDRIFSIDSTGLAAGKHLLEVSATDASNRAAETLRIPFWVDGDRPFDWRDAVVYFVFTDRFRNGDVSNDAPEGGVLGPANWGGGDWQGLEAVIEEGYFDDLGVNVLWISPQIDATAGSWPGADGRQYTGYHGYWPGQPRTAEEHFGGMAALQSAIEAAHARGIRVILDVVLNHVHQTHPYFVQQSGPPRFHPLYVCGYELPIECWFTSYLPDLDHRDLEIADLTVADARWWIEQTGADGLRVDAVKHFEHSLGRALRDETRTRFEIGGDRFWMVGETFVGRWIDAGQAELIRGYVSPRELDGQFDFPLYWEITRTIGRNEGTLRDLEKVLSEEQGFYGPDALMGTFLGNHDVARFVSHASGDIADLFGGGSQAQGWTSPPGQPAQAAPYRRLQSAFTLLFALPGVPTIYYGDEIGLAGAGDPDNRRMMPWSGVFHPEQIATRERVSALAAARREHPELSRGTVTTAFLENELLVVEREWEGRVAYVAVNRGTVGRTIVIPAAAKPYTVYESVVGGEDSVVENGMITLVVPAGAAGLWVRN